MIKSLVYKLLIGLIVKAVNLEFKYTAAVICVPIGYIKPLVLLYFI